MSHAFVVPAYGESLHLQACLHSLKTQTRLDRIILVTSTPSAWLDEVAASHGLPLVVHGPNRGIAHDWNTALAQAGTTWATIAHQDDIYHPRFAEATLQALAMHQDALLAFTDYEEATMAGLRRGTSLLRIKRVLLEAGFLGRDAIRSRRARGMTLRFGCPIPCPSVTLRVDANVRFDESLGVGLDWAAWLELCDRPGAFVWVREVLMAHRIHGDSETTAAIGGGRRAMEDENLLRRLWPDWIARMIVRSYRLAYASNKG